MARSRSSLLLVVAAGSAALLLTGPPLGTAGPQRATQAKLSAFPAFLYSPVGSGHLRGSIAATQRTRTPRADAFTSLHGLKPSTEYRVWLTKLPCTRLAREADAILDLVGTTRTGASEDDFFVRRSGALKAKLSKGKAFRLLEGDRQILCVSANRVR